MKISNIALMLLLSSALSLSTAFAQHSHSNHQHGSVHDMNIKNAPHGGELKDAGKYKVEMVADLFLKEDQLVFYIYKGNLKPVSIEGISGTIRFVHKDGTSSTDTLYSKGGSHFVAQLENKEDFQCVVSFFSKDKIFSTVYSHLGLGLNSLGKYSCPMHSDVESNTPGNCHKCGMKLVFKEQGLDNHPHHDH